MYSGGPTTHHKSTYVSPAWRVMYVCRYMYIKIQDGAEGRGRKATVALPRGRRRVKTSRGPYIQMYVYIYVCMYACVANPIPSPYILCLLAYHTIFWLLHGVER